MTQTTLLAPHRAAFLVTFLCWVIVVFDGYDLIVYGTVLPELLKEPGWQLNKSTAGLLGSLAFLGMLIGAVFAGVLADRLGRRRVILVSTAWFSVFTALCAFAPGPEVFGLLRFLAGLGLGGLVPSANALATEFVAPRHRAVVSTLMMSGVPIGGVLAAVIGIGVLPRFGWPAMFLIAVLAVVVVMPLCLKLLPESPSGSAPTESTRGPPRSRHGLVCPRATARPRRRPGSCARCFGRRTRPRPPCTRWRPWRRSSPGTAWPPGCPSSCGTVVSTSDRPWSSCSRSASARSWAHS
ncbi:hypothetical protein SHKM778_48650 [Streptomyces sp. KM77-8]|uniref:Major facilitator superfamily (MFS) profile domain-containing protein n=1 Tax=Streptomyces haneummycinicus TaxID=3074435 RepID=A0AAT9HM37_9ACTN